MDQTKLLVLVSLIASATAEGYPREGPSPAQPQSLASNTAAPPQPQSGSGTPAAVPATATAAPPLYPGLSFDYVSRYQGPTAFPSVLPDGHIADTAAVAAARAAHLAALARAKSLWYGPRDDGSYDPYKYGDYAYNYNRLLGNTLGAQLGVINPNLIPTYLQSLGSKPYYGPMDTNLGIPKGYVDGAKAAEMAREAQVKALEKARAEAFLNANMFQYAGLYSPYLQSVLNGTNYNPLAALLGIYTGVQGPLNRPYFGPLASPTLLSSGYLADTPEVAAARAAHVAALLRAKALLNVKGASDVARYGGYYQQLYKNYLQYLNGVGNLSGTPKEASDILQGLYNTPGVLPSGYIPTTAAARDAHLSALAGARVALHNAHHLFKRSG